MTSSQQSRSSLAPFQRSSLPPASAPSTNHSQEGTSLAPFDRATFGLPRPPLPAPTSHWTSPPPPLFLDRLGSKFSWFSDHLPIAYELEVSGVKVTLTSANVLNRSYIRYLEEGYPFQRGGSTDDIADPQGLVGSLITKLNVERPESSLTEREDRLQRFTNRMLTTETSGNRGPSCSIVVHQEVHHLLAAELANGSCDGMSCSSDGSDRGVTLWKGDQITHLKGGPKHTRSYTTDRDHYFAVSEFDIGGSTIRVANVHLPPGYPRGTAAALANLIRSYSEDGTPLFVIGDFNRTPETLMAMSDSPSGSTFGDMLNNFDLDFQIVSPPYRTHVTPGTRQGVVMDFLLTVNCSAEVFVARAKEPQELHPSVGLAAFHLSGRECPKE